MNTKTQLTQKIDKVVDTFDTFDQLHADTRESILDLLQPLSEESRIVFDYYRRKGYNHGLMSFDEMTRLSTELRLSRTFTKKQYDKIVDLAVEEAECPACSSTLFSTAEDVGVDEHEYIDLEIKCPSCQWRY